MDGKLQQMRLIVYGAIGLYEGQGLDMAGVLREQGWATWRRCWTPS